MEEGSLLQEALERAKTLRTSTDCESSSSSLLKNCIILDLYSLIGSYGQQDDLFYFADLADYCNRFFQSKNHLWNYGADGPVFGIHVNNSESKSVPHLRAYCRYGPSVQDEWMAIYYISELTKAIKNDNKGELVALAWDVQDGQVALIQMADLLPTWLDEDPTDNHRYACWIQDGNIQILRKPHITLIDALYELKGRRTKYTTMITTSSHPRIQHALMYWLELNVQAASVCQRTPMILPRKVARVFQNRPELLSTAIQAFCAYIQQDVPVEPATIQPNLNNTYEDWVWTIQALSKTNYAMARTVTSPREENWASSSDSIPMALGVEVKRYQRQCKMESTKHLKHAVALGVRAVTGLELLLGNNNYDGMFASSTPLDSLEERIVYWARVEQNCKKSNGSDNNHISTNSKSSMLENFQKGPNNAEFDLSKVLKCPVFPEEAQNWTLFSHPEITLRDQIKNIMVSAHSEKNDGDDNERFCVPRPDQIDTDEWMDYEEKKNDGVGTIKSQNDLDNLLSRFQSFLKQTSDVEGVVSKKLNDSNGPEINVVNNTVDIRPRVFLNILHSVLRGEELKFNHVDAYFYGEDYNFVQEDIDGDGDGDGESEGDDLGKNKESFRIKNIMNVMDDELEARTESRRIPGTHNAYNEDGKQVKGSIDEDAHLLSNLIQSLNASGGESGPVVNILKEMGKLG
mmetsp:Transcript_57022/g.64486  ORF Transcript_57022/g.64486 Transcript_57022/m.64486 type:complete len:687 (-) Transcript_57022:105-2165(-)